MNTINPAFVDAVEGKRIHNLLV